MFPNENVEHEQAPSPLGGACREERSRQRRGAGFVARSFLWRRSTLDRVRSCGHHSVKSSGEVSVRARLVDGRLSAGLAGLASCGSVWACPVCSRKIASARQAQIEQAVTTWESHGGQVAFGTYTVSHQRGDSLTSVWDAVSSGWGALTSGRAWKRDQRTAGIEGWLRLVEVKHGSNGWHVHVHVLFFLHHALAVPALLDLTDSTLGRWRRGIGKHGFTASTRRGADISMVSGPQVGSVMADYFAKGQYDDRSAAQVAGLEVARGDLKIGGESRSPFQILAALVTDADDSRSAALWAEWEAGSKGRRQLTWAKGLREFLRVTDALREDVELAAEEVGSEVDDVAVIGAEAWKALRWSAWRLLDVIEVEGVRSARFWLDGNAIEWRTPGLLRV